MFKPAATGEVTFSGTASNFTYQLAGGDVADPVVSGSKWNFIGIDYSNAMTSTSLVGLKP